jgi:hypothetical protein
MHDPLTMLHRAKRFVQGIPEAPVKTPRAGDAPTRGSADGRSERRHAVRGLRGVERGSRRALHGRPLKGAGQLRSGIAADPGG